MAKLEERICEQCGAVYMPTHHSNKYCSEECRYEAKKNRIKRNNRKAYEKVKKKEEWKRCLVCRTRFKTVRSDVVTCSPYCQSIRKREQQKGYRQTRKEERKKKKNQQKPMSIAEFDRRAREMGLSYGHYELHLRREEQKRNVV